MCVFSQARYIYMASRVFSRVTLHHKFIRFYDKKIPIHRSMLILVHYAQRQHPRHTILYRQGNYKL